MLPKTIEMRALRFMEAGNDAIEAVKLAFEEEQNMIISLLHGSYLNKKGKAVAEIISNEIHKRVNNK